MDKNRYDEDEYDEDEMEATPVMSHGGDRFRNGASTLWRCNRCLGLFDTGPDLSRPRVVGLILFEEPTNWLEERISSYCEIRNGEPSCTCDDRRLAEQRSSGFAQSPESFFLNMAHQEFAGKKDEG